MKRGSSERVLDELVALLALLQESVQGRARKRRMY